MTCQFYFTTHDLSYPIIETIAGCPIILRPMIFCIFDPISTKNTNQKFRSETSKWVKMQNIIGIIIIGHPAIVSIIGYETFPRSDFQWNSGVEVRPRSHQIQGKFLGEINGFDG